MTGIAQSPAERAALNAVNSDLQGHVTRHEPDKTIRSDAADRKALQRQREREAGVCEVELKFSPAERAQLDRGRIGRGSSGEPYSVNEYVKTLIRRDVEQLDRDLKKLDGRVCKNCQKALPRGCGGTWGREARCLLARAEIALEL